MPSINARIIKAKRVLKVYRENNTTYNNHPEEPDTTAIVDMVADLMHLYKKLGEDPSRLVSLAHEHYSAEHKHEDEPGKHPWTVIGYYEEGRQVTADGVDARTAEEAIGIATKDRHDAGEGDGFDPICAIPGENLGIVYADEIKEGA